MAATAPVPTAAPSPASPSVPAAAGGGDSQEKTTSSNEPNCFEALMLASFRTPLRLVHPRRANRTETMWSSAISVRTDTPLRDAFATLMAENISSAVCVDAEGKVNGFLDLMNLIRFIVQLFGLSPDNVELRDFMKKVEKFNESSVKHLMEGSEKMTWCPVELSKDFSLLTAIETITRGELRRLAITQNQKVVGVLTESMIIGWVFVNLDKNPDAKKVLVKDVLPSSRNVISIEETDLAINAFKLMIDRNINSVAVVNKRGELVEVISMRDIQGVAPDCELFARLYETVKVFKEKVRKQSQRNVPYKPLFVTPNDTLDTCVRVLEREAVHQLFVCHSGSELRPHSIITAADVIKCLFPY